MTCCHEHGCTRKRPYLIRRGDFTGRVYLITHYMRFEDTHINITAKHDITEEFEAFARSEGWTPPPEASA